MNEERQGPSGDQTRDEQHGIGSINVERTAPYPDPLVNENERATYGATEQEVTRDGNVIAPTFSDTEPGAGTNYGAAGDPEAPNWGGIEDQTTLGPQQVRPPDRRLVQEGEFEAGRGASADDTPSYGRSPGNGLGGARSDEPGQPRQRAADESRPGDTRRGAQSDAAPGAGDNLGGEGAVAPRPQPGEATTGVAGMTNPTMDRINERNKPGALPGGRLTYGDPQAYAGDGNVGRFGATSGGAGEQPGGHIVELGGNGWDTGRRAAEGDVGTAPPPPPMEHEP